VYVPTQHDPPEAREHDTETHGRVGLRYEPPAVAWEEPYEAVALAVSCARQSGNPACAGGPFGS
jgi:hypothetical protein